MRPKIPIAFICSTMAPGYSSACSSAFATGMISLSTNSRTAARISCCTSVSPSVWARRPIPHSFASRTAALACHRISIVAIPALPRTLAGMTDQPWVSGGAKEPDPQARQTTVKSSDGFELGVAEYGPEHGIPVISIHGTPGSRYGGPPPDQPDLYERLGARVIGFDRPGYGLSTRRAGRVVADAAGDVEAIADGLGLDTF